ncbi:hypothetical protein [Paenibacillus sp. S150]|uniref:hypothetical protein n=1 Tax=Paenibacillus sp. S150 TaxID=2749826 RepID=UPI001C581564|nr:hypothetical protein [Paenibacillus sp. S150]MBW4085486.1 hypothetical protein [Paenibacillus sp. S150]
MALSVLFLYTSGQTGSTYGGFSSSGQQDSTLELCSVFPGQIEQLLSEFSGHIHSIIKLKASLAGRSPAGDTSLLPGTGSLSPDELDEAAAKTSGQIAAAHAEMATISGQLSFNSGVWQQILQEVSNAAAILKKIGGYMINLEPNCLEIRDEEAFRQLQPSALQSGVLSESLADTLNGIIDYLSSIHAIGSTLPDGNPDRIILRPGSSYFSAAEPFILFVAKAYQAAPGVSAGLQTAYEQLSKDLTAALEDLNTSISSLQKQQAQIAGAKAELLEKAQAEEAAEAARQVDESTPGGADPVVTGPGSEQLPGAGDNKGPVPEDASPSPGTGEEDGKPSAETPDPGAIPTPAAQNVSIPDGAAVPTATPDKGTSEEKPSVQAAPVPTAAPVPDNDYSKGGD